jgi:hypothetical protein
LIQIKRPPDDGTQTKPVKGSIPLYKGGLEGVTSGSSCIVNAYTSNHEEISNKETSTGRGIALHVVDGVGLVHALLLRSRHCCFRSDAGVQRPLILGEHGKRLRHSGRGSE